MKRIYLDNAATTPMLPEVVECMAESMLQNFGNPSSTHQFGRTAKSAVETTRKQIAKYFNVHSSEIVFTSGGTEGDNIVLQNAVINLGVTRIVTTKLEHHAVLHTVDFLEEKYGVEVVYLEVDQKGCYQIEALEEVLNASDKKTLVTLMWVNNELGNIAPVKEIAEVCQRHAALFHSDSVQAIGHVPIDLQEVKVDFMVASAHKFHGPKGVGFLYVRKGHVVKPMLHGGDQERGVRSSTENVHGIIGMGRALEISLNVLNEEMARLNELKSYFISSLKTKVPGVLFNGESENLRNSSPTIVSVRFPLENPMMLFNLDIKGIAVSGGSACQSGSAKGSHVLQACLPDVEAAKTSIRFSFSKLTTKDDVETALEAVVG